MQKKNAMTATAPAPIATIPAVLVRLCTRERIGGSPVAANRRYWKVIGNESVLFAVFFSPGTGSTFASTV